jgi:hypothetical protein
VVVRQAIKWAVSQSLQDVRCAVLDVTRRLWGRSERKRSQRFAQRKRVCSREAGDCSDRQRQFVCLRLGPRLTAAGGEHGILLERPQDCCG